MSSAPAILYKNIVLNITASSQIIITSCFLYGIIYAVYAFILKIGVIAMNNKRGGAGAKIILVLILMIASAVGGAYGYRVLDGKMAVSEAKKEIEAVRLSDYESPESTEVQNLIDTINKDLETTMTRREVYERMEDFHSDLAKIQTKAQKELAAARKEAEDARNQYNNNNNNNSNNRNGNNNNNNYNDYDDSGNNNYNNDNSNGYNSNDSDYNNGNNGNSNSNDGSNSYNSNNNGNAITNDDGSSNRGGLFGSLLGNGDN